MTRVIATEKGYFGGEVRDVGAGFNVPDDLWNDKKRRPKWAKLDPGHVVVGKGDHAGGNKTTPAAPAGKDVKPISIPTDWQNKGAAERKALAKAITGQNAPNVADADRVIAAYVESSKPAPFSDAPAPETAGNGMQAALGGVEPDWIAPGSGGPKAVDD